MCVHRVITFSLLSDADLGDRPTLQQLQILRGHGEEVKIISEVAYQICDSYYGFDISSYNSSGQSFNNT